MTETYTPDLSDEGLARIERACRFESDCGVGWYGEVGHDDVLALVKEIRRIRSAEETATVRCPMCGAPHDQDGERIR